MADLTRITSAYADALEAICRAACLNIHVLADASGYSRMTCERTVVFLRKHGLIERRSCAGLGYLPTEKGMIVCALLKGQAARSRHLRLIKKAA